MIALPHRALLTIALLLVAAGCQTTPPTEARKEALLDDGQASLKRFQAEDPGIADVVHRGYGYAIFPDVGKGAFVVGAGYGHGAVYEQGQFIGYADITQATVGAQIGGGDYAELIIFENRDALERFKNNELTFAAGASAVAIKAGVAKSARFENGVMVFTQAKAGAMASAAVGGQKFTFAPSDRGTTATTRPSDHDTGGVRIETKTETHEKI
jgi:lipid-binding SYLF domain-containing protein